MKNFNSTSAKHDESNADAPAGAPSALAALFSSPCVIKWRAGAWRAAPELSPFSSCPHGTSRLRLSLLPIIIMYNSLRCAVSHHCVPGGEATLLGSAGNGRLRGILVKIDSELHQTAIDIHLLHQGTAERSIISYG